MMPGMGTAETLEAFLQLAKERGLVAFAVTFVGMDEEKGYVVRSGAASRLDESTEATQKILESMVEGINRVMQDVMNGKVKPEYLN